MALSRPSAGASGCLLYTSPAATKVRILTVSFVLMGASAFFVRKPVVWIVLGCVALFLLYLMLVRIPTISLENVRAARKADEAE